MRQACCEVSVFGKTYKCCKVRYLVSITAALVSFLLQMKYPHVVVYVLINLLKRTEKVNEFW